MIFRAISAFESKSQFRRNLSRVTKANLFALLLPILIAPLISRFFLPADFSVLAVFTAVLTSLSAFCTWRFDWMVPNARTGAMAACLFTIGGAVLLVVCLLVAVVLLLGSSLGKFGDMVSSHLLVALIPVALLAEGGRQLFAGWFVRKGDLTVVSHTTVVRSLANAVTTIVAGLMNGGAVGLVGATVLSAWAGIAAFVRQSGFQLWLKIKRISRRRLYIAVAKYGRSATWSCLVAVVNALSMAAPVLLFAHYYSPHEVGWYALMHRLLAAPIGALTSALGQSYWSKAAGQVRESRVEELSLQYIKTTKRLLVAAVPVVCVCLMGPLFVGPVFGSDEWSGAGNVLVAMIPLFVGSILFSPTNHLVVLDKQHLQLLADTVRLLLVVVSVVSARYLDFNFIVAVALASTASFLGHAGIFLVHRWVHKNL